MDPYKRLQLARKNGRPSGRYYIEHLLTDFIELHGDRRFGDDPAIMAGIGFLGGRPVTVIAHEKGGDIRDKAHRNFGSANPEGYRKALRQMKLAEKFGRPVLCFVDTAGAFAGMGAEERGQGEAIAENLMEMMTLKVPVLSVFVGEGGSGGALALAVADEVWMLENSVYSILSPEGFASILWKDSKRAAEAAEVMKLTADDLKKLGIVEQVIAEPDEFTTETMESVTMELEVQIMDFLEKYTIMNPEELTDRRYRRFRNV